jgi:two-component system, sensor histidine kinase FlrB
MDDFEAGLFALNATVNDVLKFVPHRSPQWQSFLVGDLVEEVCQSLEQPLEEHCIDLDVDVPPNTLLTADREMFRQAVWSLVQHSIDVMPHGGELVITSYEGPTGLELEVADSGPGLSEQDLRQAYEPSTTGKQSGLEPGLVVAQQIAELHGGSVTAMNCPEGGAAITIKIPRRAMEAAA